MIAQRGTVLVTGANSYVGNAMAKTIAWAGWRIYGLIRTYEAATGLTRAEVFSVIGSPLNTSFLDDVCGPTFDVLVSNTEDARAPARTWRACEQNRVGSPHAVTGLAFG